MNWGWGECGESGSPWGVELVSGGWLIPEGALVGCVVGVLMLALCGVLMRLVGTRALWCRQEAGGRGCGGFLGGGRVSGSPGFGQIGGGLCWTG